MTTISIEDRDAVVRLTLHESSKNEAIDLSRILTALCAAAGWSVTFADRYPAGATTGYIKMVFPRLPEAKKIQCIREIDTVVWHFLEGSEEIEDLVQRYGGELWREFHVSDPDWSLFPLVS